MFRSFCLAAFVFAAFQQSFSEDDSASKAFKERAPRPAAPALLTNKYYSYEEIIKYLDGLGKAYANRVVLKDVGKSYENRTLKSITITNGDKGKNKNVIYIDAAFHAREWLTPAAALFAVEQLVVNYEKNAQLLKNYDWIILPLVNPDGYVYSRTKFKKWRKTRKPSGNKCIGTDLNRNFDFHWLEKGGSKDPCDLQIFSGVKPFSEAESIAVRDLMHSLINTKRGIMYISIHTAAEKILHPWGFNTVAPKKVDELREVAEAGSKAILAASGSKFEPLISYKFGEMGGASDDYAYCIGFPLAFTLELSGRGHRFFPPTNLIKVLVEESWAGIRAMAVKAIEKYPLPQNTPKNYRKIDPKAVKCINF